MEAKKQEADLDEIAGLEHVIALFTDETAAKRAYKDAQAALDLQTLKQYANLSETEVQTLVLDGKWQTTVTRNVSAEVESLTLALVARVQQLGKRYAETVADLHAELRSLEAKVEDHLTAMGVDS
jgi:type I restriction enzyme M protein